MRKAETTKKEPFLRHLGDAIRHRRVHLLLSQGQLATKSGLHRTYITDIENGLRNLSIKTLLRVVTALKSKLSSPILAAEKAIAKERRL
jgi:transcriptional regulator with XRE-family HTH domain